MDVTTLVMFLAPLVPYLVKGGEAIAEKIGEKFGASVWDRAKSIWSAISPQAAASPGLQEVLADLEKQPADTATRAALVYQLQKLFAKDPALKASIERIWQNTDQKAVQMVIASGERAVAAGGDISGTVVTGSIFGDNDLTRRP
jgi:hypothetical protein